MFHNARTSRDRQSAVLAERTRERLVAFVWPLLTLLNQQLDVRLVRTFVTSLHGIVLWRNRAHGLLLSELGAFIASPDHAPAGTKRLSRLLASSTWSALLITQFLWQQAHTQLRSSLDKGEEPLLVWDTSVWEKPESSAAEGLCTVRSAKARRLKRIRPGLFNPPSGRPICVRGLHWLGLLLLRRHAPPQLVAMQWWTTRGERASNQQREIVSLLELASADWGRQVRHIFDRGFASAGWVSTFVEQDIRFVLRWKKGQKLLDSWGQARKAWEITRGKRSQEYRWLRDSHTGQVHKVGIVVVAVTHPTVAQPLWLVVARAGKGREPWYLLTSDLVVNSKDAWNVALAYGRRWQIEVTWRYCKSELAMESPRLWSWERREKLLMMAALVYAFLLSLLDPSLAELREEVIRLWCHRTGKRSKNAPTPLYRLRSALSRLWLAYLSSPLFPSLNSG